MDLSRLASFQSLLIVSCGDVERNPGPPKKGQKGLCKSEVLRQFMRCIQSTLVMLLYKAKCQDPPTQLYKKDPPGWDTLDKETKFKNVCNIKRDGNQTFDKLVKLCMREKDTVPEDILYVLNCYENLRDSKNDSDETKSWKVALENYVSRNRSMKNKHSIIDHLDEKVLTEVIEKGTEGVKQGNIGFSLEGARHICGALDDLKAAVNKIMDQMTEQVKRKNLSDCAYAHAETSQKDEKLKLKRDPIKAKRLKCMVTQGSDSQTSKELGFFMEIAPDSSGGQLNMNNNLPLFDPKIPPPDPELLCLRAPCEQTESAQIEPQTEPVRETSQGCVSLGSHHLDKHIPSHHTLNKSNRRNYIKLNLNRLNHNRLNHNRWIQDSLNQNSLKHNGCNHNILNNNRWNHKRLIHRINPRLNHFHYLLPRHIVMESSNQKTLTFSVHQPEIYQLCKIHQTCTIHSVFKKTLQIVCLKAALKMKP